MDLSERELVDIASSGQRREQRNRWYPVRSRSAGRALPGRRSTRHGDTIRRADGLHREVSHMLKAIHAQESRDAVDKKARAIVDALRADKMNTAADIVALVGNALALYYRTGKRSGRSFAPRHTRPVAKRLM